jgi:hypothetical protein
MAPGDLRNMVEIVVRRIGADAARDRSEQSQVLIDLPRLDPGGRIEGRLPGAKWRIGDAVKPFAQFQGRRRHLDGGAERPPDGEDHRRQNRKQR